MKTISLKKILILLVLLLLTLYLFWGPLFPWSPVKCGFRKIPSSKAAVYITEYDSDSIIFNIDEIITEEEAFHNMQFQEKFKIIVLGKESNMKRFLPWLGGTGYSVKLGFFNVVYIGANARNSPYGIEVFLKHEISHLLIHQNAGSRANNMEIQEQGWLSEGVATYFGGPHYFDKDEFVRTWKGYGFAFDSLYEGNPLKLDKSIFHLRYTYYRFFVEYLINTYGLKTFQTYLKVYTHAPEKYKTLFREVYDADLGDILEAFSVYMET